MEVIASNKGGVKLCFDGFMYTKKITRTKITWRCAQTASFNCSATMTTDLQVCVSIYIAKGTQRMLTFASQCGHQHLADSRRWFIDGTFSVASKIFDQLYVIRVPLGDTSVSVVYALLPGRTQELYAEM